MTQSGKAYTASDLQANKRQSPFFAGAAKKTGWQTICANFPSFRVDRMGRLLCSAHFPAGGFSSLAGRQRVARGLKIVW